MNELLLLTASGSGVSSVLQFFTARNKGQHGRRCRPSALQCGWHREGVKGGSRTCSLIMCKAKYKTTSFTCPLKLLPFTCTLTWETPLRESGVWWTPLNPGPEDESHAEHRWMQSCLGAQADTPWEEAALPHLLQDLLCPSKLGWYDKHSLWIWNRHQLRWVCS